MYAVIFTATIRQLDSEYSRMAGRLRDLALAEYGCLEFTSANEGTREIAVSYWDSEDQIRSWKNDAEHRVAQELGRSAWYESYRVEIVRLIRRYGSDVNEG